MRAVAARLVLTALCVGGPVLLAQTRAQDVRPDGAAYPIDLATTLRLAGAKSVDVQIARERLEAARAGATSANLQFFPWLSASASYRRHGGLTQDVLGNVIEADKDSYLLGGALALQMDLGDAIYKSLAAKQSALAAESGLEAQRQETLLGAAQAYFELLIAQGVTAAAADALRISRDYEDQLHRAVDAGIALKGDELRVKVQTQRNRLALQQAAERSRVVSARLAEALRLPPAVELVAQDKELAPLALISPTQDVDGLVVEALEARPETKESAALVQAAQQIAKGAEYGPLIPTILAGASVGQLGGGRDGGPTNSGASRDYVAAVAWRVGPGGLFDSGRTRLARAHQEEARWSAEKLRDGISRQVVEAHVRVVSEQEQLETAREALQAAEQGLALARGRMQFEVAVVLENILAEQDQTRARQDYVRAIGEYDKAQYALMRAVGRLVTNAGGSGADAPGGTQGPPH